MQFDAFRLMFAMQDVRNRVSLFAATAHSLIGLFELCSSSDGLWVELFFAAFVRVGMLFLVLCPILVASAVSRVEHYVQTLPILAHVCSMVGLFEQKVLTSCT